MEDRWTIYIREKAKERNIPNPWLTSQGSERNVVSDSGKAS